MKTFDYILTAVVILLGITFAGLLAARLRAPNPPAQVQTQFENDFATFVKQAHKMHSFIRQEAPHEYREQQGIALRGALADLTPVTRDDQRRFARAQELVKWLQTYSNRIEALARSIKRCRNIPADPPQYSDDYYTRKVLEEDYSKYIEAKSHADTIMSDLAISKPPPVESTK